MDDPNQPRNKQDCVFDLLIPLTAFGAKLFMQEGISARDDILPATGKSPRGLAFDAITEFIEGGMKFHARSPQTYEKDLFNLLKAVVHHDFLDLVKSHEYQRTKVIDATRSADSDETGFVLEEMGTGGLEKGFHTLEHAMLARRFFPIVQDEPDLIELLEAILCFGVTKREDIAHILKVTPQEVTNRKNRLRVRLAVWYRSVLASRKVVSTHG